MIAPTTATAPRLQASAGPASPIERTAVTSGLPPTGATTSTAAGTCCRKMIAAMPSVNPSTTGHGMNATARPSLATPASRTIAPARTATIGTAAAP